MRRRGVLEAVAGAAAAVLLGGHTPYGQWVVYRRKHLLIGCHKGDPQTYALARLVVEILDAHLAAAAARVARAPAPSRLASLLATDQLDVAVLGWDDAKAMAAGEGVFAAYGAISLGVLTPVVGRVLVAHDRLPPRHAWLVCAALAGDDVVAAAQAPGDMPLGWHRGAAAFRAGDPEPALDE